MSAKKTKSLIRGGQLFLYNTRMFAQVVGRITKWAIFIYFAIVVLIMLCLMQGFDWHVLALQVYSTVLNWFGAGHVHVWTNPANSSHYMTAKFWLTSSEQNIVAEAFNNFLKSLSIAMIVGLVIYVLITKLFTRLFIKSGEKHSGDKHISGTRLAVSVKETIKSVEHSRHGASDIKIGNILPMPKFSVWQGLLYHGSTGSGKTQGLMRLLDEIERSGDPAIIYDKECALKPYFFRDDIDRELNPLSKSCEWWDMWAECSNPIELAALATYLMPKAVQGSDPFWVDAARAIFTATAWEMREQDDKSPIVLLQMLLTTQLDQLRAMLAGTEAENLVSKDIEKTAISIRAVMATYTKSLRFLEGLENDKTKAAFSIKKWIAEQADSTASKKGWLWITSRAKFHAEIKPLLSAWLGMAMKGIQSLDPHTNKSKRFWIVMDEMASLHRLEDLSDVTADIRKFGGCVAIGLASISQLQFIYGRDEATAISDLLNTTCYYRSPKEIVADWVSKDLGPQTVEEARETQSYGPNPIRDGNTIGSQRVTRRTVETGTIMQLSDLSCYVRLSGNHPITLVEQPYVEDREVRLETALVERPIDWDAIKKVTDAAHAAELNPNVSDGVKEEQAHNKKVEAVANHPELADSPKKLADFVDEVAVINDVVADKKAEQVFIDR